jgi:hypothetical protein
MHLKRNKLLAFGGLLAVTGIASIAARADVALAGTRTVFFMNEPIELAVSGAGALTVRHDDGSTLTIALPASGSTRLVTLKPNTLKPGEYVATDGTAHSAHFTVSLPQHPNAFFTAQWVQSGGTAENAAAKGGWMYFNSDYVSMHPRAPQPGDIAEAYVAARMKPYALMVLGGGHQLDLDVQNDWGDPWVQRAIVWRMNLAALSDRIYPIAGLHTFDEPGLTWWPVPTGEKDDKGNAKIELSPYAIPHQLEEFQKISGKTMPFETFTKAGPHYAEHMDDWLAFMGMRMKYLEQAWWADRWGTDAVEPAFKTLNQVSSSYAPGDTTDGVDTRQNRPYDIVSGHGGYSDLPFGTFQPVQSAEGFQGFSEGKPHYFLPMWYTHIWSSMRNAIWMSWATKLEGMMCTPEQDFGLTGSQFGFHGTNTVFEVAEINRRLALVGDAIKQLPRTPAPVAVLHSWRQAAWDIAAENHPELAKNGVPHYVSRHRDAVSLSFWRLMDMGLLPNWIDESEASAKGAAFLKQWKVIVLPRLTTISPELRKALEEYIAGGGKLVQFKDDTLKLPGALISDADFGDSSQHYKDVTQTDATQNRDLNWRAWNEETAGHFARDINAWIGARPYRSSNPNVFVNPQRAGAATYLLIANNAQSAENPRGLKHELIPTSTAIAVPGGGVLYDLFNGGTVPVQSGQAQLALAAGDGACWLHLPAAPGAMKLSAKVTNDNAVQIALSWGRVGYLPFRLRVFDPAGVQCDELFRATAPQNGVTHFAMSYPLGANAAPGAWSFETYEWLTGKKATAKVTVKPATRGAWSTLDADKVSIYFDDAQKIRDLFAGKAAQPEYSKLNWDSKRVFGLDPKKFAVFGDEANADKIAAALRAKGMTVAVNPKYEIVPFQHEPNRGGAGPKFREANYENIYAHAIVLPGHPLAAQAQQRGHINRPVTKAFPGAGRAFIQWGLSAYQAGWNDVWVFGDENAGVQWLLNAINNPQIHEGESTRELNAALQPTPRAKTQTAAPHTLSIVQQVNTPDTPVGVASSEDGKVLYLLQRDGTAAAYDAHGKVLWRQQTLLIGNDLALSPRGNRIAISGYPGLLVLDVASGKVLGGYHAPAVAVAAAGKRPLMTGIAWSDDSQLVAAGWADNYPANDKDVARLPAVVLDAGGKVLRELAVAGDVMGAAFAPGSETLLLGADQLTAINAQSGAVLWQSPLKGVQAFAFAPDGKTAVAGGWGQTAGVVDLADGKIVRQAKFDAVVGGVALLPSGDLVAAVWGGTKPLYVLRAGQEKPQPFFQSRFGFQNVQWSPQRKALVAGEEGGDLWLLDSNGKVLGKRSDAGTTAYRMHLRGNEVLLARMNRVAQRVALP